MVTRPRVLPFSVAGCLALAGCAGGGGGLRAVPAWPLPNSQPPDAVAGSAIDDVWGVAAPDVGFESARHEILRLNGSEWEGVPLPSVLESAPELVAMEPISIVSAGPGEVWAAKGRRDGTATLVRLDASGAVVEDRTADIAPSDPGHAGSASLWGGEHGVFARFAVASSTASSAIYHLDGGSFAVIPDVPAQSGPRLVVGPDQALFEDATGFVWYDAGSWTPLIDTFDGAVVTMASGPDHIWVVDTLWGMAHGDGATWTTVSVVDYVTSEPTETQSSPFGREPRFYGVDADGDLAVFSTYSRYPSGSGWTSMSYVEGRVGTDGHYVDEITLAAKGKCVGGCPGIGTWNPTPNNDGIRLDDGTLLLLELDDDELQILAWRP